MRFDHRSPSAIIYSSVCAVHAVYSDILWTTHASRSCGMCGWLEMKIREQKEKKKHIQDRWLFSFSIFSLIYFLLKEESMNWGFTGFQALSGNIREFTTPVHIIPGSYVSWLSSRIILEKNTCSFVCVVIGNWQSYTKCVVVDSGG